MGICRISKLLLKLWKCTFYELGAIVLFKWIYSYWQETLEYCFFHIHTTLLLFVCYITEIWYLHNHLKWSSLRFSLSVCLIYACRKSWRKHEFTHTIWVFCWNIWQQSKSSDPKAFFFYTVWILAHVCGLCIHLLYIRLAFYICCCNYKQWTDVHLAWCMQEVLDLFLSFFCLQFRRTPESPACFSKQNKTTFSCTAWRSAALEIHSHCKQPYVSSPKAI